MSRVLTRARRLKDGSRRSVVQFRCSHMELDAVRRAAEVRGITQASLLRAALLQIGVDLVAAERDYPGAKPPP